MKGHFYINNDILSMCGFDLDEAVRLAIGELLNNMDHGLTWYARRSTSNELDVAEYMFTDKPLPDEIILIYENGGWEINKTL